MPGRGKLRAGARTSYRSSLWILQIGSAAARVGAGVSRVPVVADLAAVLSLLSPSPMTRDVRESGVVRPPAFARDARHRGKAQFRRLPGQRVAAWK